MPIAMMFPSNSLTNRGAFFATVMLPAAILFSGNQSASGEPAAPAKSAKAAPAAPRAPEVGVVEIKAVAQPVVRVLPGRVKSLRVAQVRARVPGVLQKQIFRDGADVKEGDPLFQIDVSVYEARLASAKATVAQAEANIARADANFDQASKLAKRYRELVKSNAVSQQELDNAVSAELQAIADKQGAKANLLAAQAARQTAEIDLGYTKVIAPISGRIGRPFVTEGALVGQGDVTLLAEINQFDRVYVDVVQPSGDLLALRQKAGASLDKVKLTLLLDNGEEYKHPGKALLSEIAVDPGTSSVTWRIEFPNPDKLLWPGTYVRVRFEYDDGKTAFLIPQQAVLRDAKTAAPSVFVVDGENKISSVSVHGSEASGPNWVVREGDFKDGMKVVVEGGQRAMVRLAPGASVVPVAWVPVPPVTAHASETAKN